MTPGLREAAIAAAERGERGPAMRDRRVTSFSFVRALVCGVLVALLPATAGATGPRAVIELFTSQGCSSCPPADKLLGELARDPSLVAMSLPVDYWDYLGWKDTLASPYNTARQRAYARLRGDRQVYTPQVVVNGRTHAIGSDRAAIEEAIAQTRRAAATMSVPVTLTASSQGLAVSVGESASASAGEVWLYALSSAVPVKIGRGENTGRTITYVNVCRRWVKLGDWHGKAASWTVPLAEIRGEGINAAAVIVQGGRSDSPGAMLGAAFAALD
jgi:hypothetical protein